MKLMPNWNAEHGVTAIICVLAQDGVPGNAKYRTDVHDHACMALACRVVIAFWSSWPGEFIFPALTSGVSFVYPTNQLPDAASTKLISRVSFGSWGLLSVVIRTDRSVEAGDILNDTEAPASALVDRPHGKRWLWPRNGKTSTQVNTRPGHFNLAFTRMPNSGLTNLFIALNHNSVIRLERLD